jgi:D-alanyl-D-alanine carboxypeptidase (penicillin-binding protein 5/6)
LKPARLLLALCVAVSSLFIPLASVSAEPNRFIPVLAPAIEESLHARAAVLMDAGTGQVLINKQGDERFAIASVTKIMTLLLVLEANEDGRVQLADEVVATPHACSYGGSQIYLEPGERFTLQELLMAVTIKSANDAAVALAEHVAGSEAAFVAMMNQRADELGMKNTHFINACGLDDVSASGLKGEKGYSSAVDVALMSKEVMRFYPLIGDWLTTRITYLQRASGPVELFNTNHRFIRGFQGADGLKTGLTDEARYCLSATATRNGFSLIAVVLGVASDDLRYQDVATLLNYGYANYVGSNLVSKGDQLTVVPVNRGQERMVPVVAAENLAVLLPKGQVLAEIQQQVELEPKLFAPIAAGQPLGKLKAVKDGEVLGEVDLIAAEAVAKLGFFGRLGRMFEDLFR